MLYDDAGHAGGHSGTGNTGHGVVSSYIRQKQPTGHISEFIHG